MQTERVRDRIIALKLKGLRNGEVASQVGCTPNLVGVVWHHYRQPEKRAERHAVDAEIAQRRRQSDPQYAEALRAYQRGYEAGRRAEAAAIAQRWTTHSEVSNGEYEA